MQVYYLFYLNQFTNLKELQTIDTENIKALEEFKNKYYVSDEQIQDMQKITVLPERAIQDYKSTYNDIRTCFSV